MEKAPLETSYIRLDTDTELSASWPSVSVNGETIAFAAREGGRSRIWLVAASGGTPTPLTPNSMILNATRPSWSPAEATVAFRVSPGGNKAPGNIWTINADGTDIGPYTQEPDVSDFYPQWLPDGRGIAITRRDSGTTNNHIWVGGDKGALEKITDGPYYDGKLTVSPHGDAVAFASNRSGELEIWVASLLHQGKLRQLTSNQGRSPSWSPDGKWIAFESDRNTDYAIYIRQADGSGTTIQLTDGSSDEKHPEWSRDGRTIVFDAARNDKDGRRRIGSVNISCSLH
ncbi:MAG: hypothetical protein GY813_13390 [Halieaceae bacterium]|nr:hypothetical protein [Halieaceae bacterium]